MALVRENDLTEGMSGKFGRKIVFRVVKGVTVASRKSTRQLVVSEKQLEHRLRFKRAAEYARAKMLDPIAKAEYKHMAGDKAFATAFNAALKDYMTAPDIYSVNVSEFAGAVGNTILVSVAEKLKTTRVKIDIYLSNGTLHESGDAISSPGDVEWKYALKQAMPSLAGTKIVATAFDRPGNEATKEVVIE